ncbi:MAG: alpha/beta hydrolase [Chloroflexi bacterium]|nr:alpha/beta hydrolase [Chloroflexota bacterium]
MLKQKMAVPGKLILLGLAAFFLAHLTLLGSAFLTDNISVVIGAALIVLCAVNFIGQYFLLGRHFTKRVVVVQSASVVILVSVFYVTILMPATGEKLPNLADVQYWDLATGSRIAYIKLEPEELAHDEPIIFLHGGPGVPDMEGDSAYFGRLREEGYVVYVYDQVGAGRSSRLQDPSGYGIERDVADLEEIRRQIGAEKLILIGHSYGARLAATYIAEHGGHVTKFIASSPGALVGGLATGGDFQQRLTTAQKLSIYSLILQPRPLTAYMLLQINPRAAHNFAGDLEMDARNDEVYAVADPAVRCGNEESTHRLHGVGFYASQFPQSAQQAPLKDITEELKHYQIPTLVIKGSCDYLTWASALDYLDAFQEGPAQLVYLSGAGHNAYQDKPREFELNLKAFLNGQPLPDQYISRDVPADYEKGY